MFILILLGTFLVSFNAYSGPMYYTSGSDLMGHCEENLALVEVVTKDKIIASYSCAEDKSNGRGEVILDGYYRNPLSRNTNSVSLNQVQFEYAHECRSAARNIKYIISEKQGLKIVTKCDADNILSVTMVRD